MKNKGRIIPIFLFIALLLGGCTTAGKPAKQDAPVSTRPSPKVRFVKFKTRDGLTLSGRLFGDGPVGVILAHMYPADQKSWSPTARTLSEQGYTVLTFDFRGYGLSGGVKDIPKIDIDMQAALEYLRRTNSKIFLVGASMGGTAALKTATQTRVAGIAVASAPAEFMGLESGSTKNIKGPKLFMATGGDFTAPETARRFYNEADEPREIQILPGADHGTDMFGKQDSKALEILIDWLKRYN